MASKMGQNPPYQPPPYTSPGYYPTAPPPPSPAPQGYLVYGAPPPPFVVLRPVPTPNQARVNNPDPVVVDCWGKHSQICTCPSCGFTGDSDVRHQAGAGTWIICILLLICFWPIAWLPFCIDGMQDAFHHCASCDHLLGERKVC